MAPHQRWGCGGGYLAITRRILVAPDTQRENMPQEYFEITSVCREDIAAAFGDTEEAHKRAAKITDHQMERLASKMADDYIGQLYWIQLEILANDLMVGDE